MNKDTASINSFNGVNRAPETCKLYKQLGLEFIFVVDSGSATQEMKTKLDEGDFEKYFVEIKDILEKQDVDTEDLIHPKLYYQAFELAYKSILDNLPSLEDINNIGLGKKQVHRYCRWFSDNDKGDYKYTEYD